MARSPLPARLADVDEDRLLALILPLMGHPDERIELGPGDDAAVVAAPDGRVVATTDTMTRLQDWRDDWSTGEDVGRKIVAQNLGDIAAMGARPTGLLVTLIADPQLALAWVADLARGVGAAAADAGCPVLGGDLGGAPKGSVTVSVTALGDLEGHPPVRRSGAIPGQTVAVAGTLGRSGAGLALLLAGRGAGIDEVVQALVAAHLAPVAPYAQGPLARAAGATAMIDVSDDLLRDTGRMARASGVAIDLDTAALEPDVAAIAPALGPERALDCVLTGGEEHSLVATFPAERGLPVGWRAIGRVRAGEGVYVDGDRRTGGGWDHFAG